MRDPAERSAVETRLEPTGETPLLPAAVKAGSAEGEQKAFWGSGSSLGVSLVKTVHIAEDRPRVFYTGAFSVTTSAVQSPVTLGTDLGAAFQACLARALPSLCHPNPASPSPLYQNRCEHSRSPSPRELSLTPQAALGHFLCIPTAPRVWCTQGEGLCLPLFLKLRSFSAFL